MHVAVGGRGGSYTASFNPVEAGTIELRLYLHVSGRKMLLVVRQREDGSSQTALRGKYGHLRSGGVTDPCWKRPRTARVPVPKAIARKLAAALTYQAGTSEHESSLRIRREKRLAGIVCFLLPLPPNQTPIAPQHPCGKGRNGFTIHAAVLRMRRAGIEKP